MQQSSHVFTVRAPPSKVFEFVTDMEKVASCIPQVEHVRVISQSESEWRVRISAGFVSQVVILHVKIEDVKPIHSLVFHGTGMNVRLVGQFSLRPLSEDETEVSFTATVEAKGPLANIIDIVMGSAADRLAQDAVKNLKERLED